MMRFTSSVPVTGGPPAAVLGHSQKSISNLQDNAVNKVPRESGAVSNHFDSVSGLEPGSPAAPGGPGVFITMATLPVVSDVRSLHYDLAAPDVTSPLLLGLGLVGQLVVSRLPHEAHLQEEELNVRTTPTGAPAQNCKTRNYKRQHNPQCVCHRRQNKHHYANRNNRGCVH